MNITKDLPYEEVIHSDTALIKGIKNEPNERQLKLIVVWAKHIFQPVRDHFNVPIFVSSGFRCEELNQCIGGSKTSDHMAKIGAAGDLKGRHSDGITNKMIFDFIKENLEFDQLIWEYGTAEEPYWVHVGFREGKNRNMIIINR